MTSAIVTISTGSLADPRARRGGATRHLQLVRSPGARPARRSTDRRAPGSRAPARRSGDATALRVTRRCRLLLSSTVAAMLSISALSGLDVGGALAGVSLLPPPEVGGYVTVTPGDTLWGIAGNLAPQRDRREVVASILELNDLQSANLAPGTRLAVPSAP